jgi:hypothetical protein
MTEILFNNKEEPSFNLEARLTSLANKCKNTYTIAALDCCRVIEPQVKQPETKTAEETKTED